MNQIQNAMSPINVMHLPGDTIGLILALTFPRIDRSAIDAHAMARVSGTCRKWWRLVTVTLGGQRLRPAGLRWATHVHADAGWDLKRIINGLIGGNGGQDIGVIFTQGPFREDEASTPQLISTPKDTNVAVQYPLDLVGQPESFDKFWSGLPKMMKRRAWRNHWRMAFHPSVYVDIQRSQRPACECRSCKDRKALFDPA